MKRLVKIGLIEMPPLVTSCALNDSCPERGLAVDGALIVCEALDFNCTFEWFPSDEYGDTDENGTSTGITAAIQQGVYDTSAPTFTPTYRRLRAIDFSHTYFTFDTVLTTRALDRLRFSEIDWGIMAGYQRSVWWTFVAAFAMCAALITFFMRNCQSFFNGHSIAKQNVVSYYLQTAMNLIKNDCDPNLLHSLPMRICYGAWILASLVLTSSYTGKLFANRVVQNKNVPFTDLESFVTCMERGRCRIVTHTESISFFQQLTVAGSDVSNRISKALKSYPAVLIKETDIAEAILREKRYYLVWLWPREWVYYSTQGNKGCKYHVVRTPFMEVDTFPVRKNSSLLEDLNRVSFSFRENKIHYPILERYFHLDSCGDPSPGDSKKGTPPLLTALYFYILGMGVAIVTMAVEAVISRLKKGRYELRSRKSRRLMYR